MPICKSSSETAAQACNAVSACPADSTSTLALPSWISVPFGATTLVHCALDSATVEQDNSCEATLKPGGPDLTAKVGFASSLNNGATGLLQVTIGGVSRNPGFTMPVTFDRIAGGTCTIKLRSLAAKITTKPVFGSYTAESGFMFLPKPVSTSINCSTGTFSFAANTVKLNMDWRQKNNSTSVISHDSMLMQNSSALTGTLNLSTNKITFSGSFTGSFRGATGTVALNTVEGTVSAL